MKKNKNVEENRTRFNLFNKKQLNHINDEIYEYAEEFYKDNKNDEFER